MWLLLEENGIYTSDFNFVMGDHLYCGSKVAQVWHFEKSPGITQSALLKKKKIINNMLGNQPKRWWYVVVVNVTFAF